MTALFVSSLAATLLLVAACLVAGAWIESETAVMSDARHRFNRWRWQRKARRLGGH